MQMFVLKIMKIFEILVTVSLEFCATATVTKCQCVPHSWCKRSTYRTDIFDSREFSKICTNAEYLCCNLSDVIPVPRVKSIPKPFAECAVHRTEIAVGNVSKSSQFPWMVAILQKSQKHMDYTYDCGGSLIHPSVVLTVAHCVYPLRKSPNHVIVRVRPQTTYSAQRNVKKIVVHEDFYSEGLFNDVGLLILEKPFEISGHINVICLANNGMDSRLMEYENCFATGWDGYVAQANQMNVKTIYLPIVPRDKCIRQLRKTKLGSNFELHRTFLCAGGQNQIDTCKGDGGNPLICPVADQNNRFQQIGIVSWGIGCGQDQVPGVYVNVASLIDWIDDQFYYNRLNFSAYRQ